MTIARLVWDDAEALSRNAEELYRLLGADFRTFSRCPIPSCRRKLPFQEILALLLHPEDTILCEGCGEELGESILSVMTEGGDARIAAPQDFLWYHSTTGDNWEETVVDGTQSSIHCGEKLSALLRALQLHTLSLRRNREAHVDMYTLELVSAAEMRGILYDNGDEWDVDPAAHDVYGYTNEYEAPGTVSIFAGHRAVRVVEAEAIELQAFRARVCELMGVRLVSTVAQAYAERRSLAS